MSLAPFSQHLSRVWRFPDLTHESVECLVIAIRQCAKYVGPLEYAFSDSCRNHFGQDEKFLFVSFKRVSQTVNQGLAWIVPKVKPAIFDATQVRESHVNLLG